VELTLSGILWWAFSHGYMLKGDISILRASQNKLTKLVNTKMRVVGLFSLLVSFL